MHHLNTQPAPLPEDLEHYQRLIDKLIEKDRDARFRNADEVIGFLARNFEKSPRSRKNYTKGAAQIARSCSGRSLGEKGFEIVPAAPRTSACPDRAARRAR